MRRILLSSVAVAALFVPAACPRAANYGPLQAQNNLSDVESAASALANLGAVATSAPLTQFTALDGTTQVQIAATSGAADYLTFSGGRTGIGPTIVCNSTIDANVPCGLVALGTGSVYLSDGAGALATFGTSSAGTATSNFVFSAGDATHSLTIGPAGTGNGDLVTNFPTSETFQVNGTQVMQVTAGGLTLGIDAGGAVRNRFDSAVANIRSNQFLTAGNLRWVVGADSSSESGSNHGSDYIVDRYSDAGSYIDQPVRVARFTGLFFANDGIDITTEVVTSGSSGTISSCGTGTPTILGNDISAVVTVGTGSVAACTVTFSAAAASSGPMVFVEANGTTAEATSVSNRGTAGFTANFSPALPDGGTFSYWVIQ